MQNQLKYGVTALLAALLAACMPPPPTPAVSIQSTTGITQVAVSNALDLKATTSNPVALNWSVNGVAGGNDTVGKVNPNATAAGSSNIVQYSAPSTIPTPPTVTVRATNPANGEFGEINLTIIQQGQGGISGTVTVPGGLLSLSSSTLGVQGLERAVQKPFQADWSLPHAPGVVLVVGNAASNSGLGIASAPSLQGVRLERVTDTVSLARVPVGEEAALAARITSETGAFVQPNYIYRPLEAAPVPNDPEYSAKQFYLTQIDAPGGWVTQTTVPDGLIAVLDTGVDLTHPDLAGRIIPGKDFCPSTSGSVCTGEDTDPSDLPASVAGGGHGTHTFGLIAAATNNAQGVAGITWGGKVLAVKVFGNFSGGAGSDSATLAKAVRYAVDAGAKVLNLSLGLQTANPSVDPDKLFADAIAYADSKNALVVAAAGNYPNTSTPDNQKTLFYPASNPLVVPVGALDQTNTIAYFSARGDDRLLMAPGTKTANAQEQIWSTAVGGGYEQRAGTSEATPMVAAVAGLIRAKNPNLSALDTVGILKSTARDLGASGRDTTYGFGLLQAGAALAKAGNPSAPPPAQTTVYVYADRLKAGGNPSNPADYDGNDPQSGRTVVILPGKSGSVNYTITAGRDGKPLQPGTYRVVACVNKNGNGVACDAGDLGAPNTTPRNYTGTPINGVDVTVGQL